MFQKIKIRKKNNDGNKTTRFYCKLCDYRTSHLSNFKKHEKTVKHRNRLWNKKKLFCSYCNECFFSRTTLWRHKKKCEKKNVGKKDGIEMKKVTQMFQVENCNFGEKTAEKGEIIFEESCKKSKKMPFFDVFDDITENQISELKDLMKTLIVSQTELHKNMKDYIENPRTINNNNCNNTMTINMFLNNDCKNAMNLEDFMNNVKISWDDLKYTERNGFVNGISNIFVKQLNDLKLTERPIHCSDTENLQFFYKDENKWEEDTQNKKMDESIKIITKKQMVHIKEWEEAHPTYTDDPKLLDEWHQMIMCLMGGKNEQEISTNNEEIKKKIGTNVNIEHLNKKLE
jgi:hypothetical protein